MSKLADHLRDINPLDYFAQSDMNYVVLFVYGMLSATVREQCDRITFTINDVTWSRDGLPIRQRYESSLQSITFRKAMRQIVERDPVVREYLRLVKQSPMIDSYEILYPELAAIGAAAGDDAASRQPIDRS
jgi:hypothetical protein